MGVIELAVYPVVRHCEEDAEISGASPAAPLAARKGAAKRAFEAIAGTGFGQEEYSPVGTVEFEPEDSAWEKIFIDYEWRRTSAERG
jgi:hypothetical protein